MVNTSKILTVSYGTFSCTLEGFDDSFDTMKAIAEYFRDLAADDRYFGATPPTPDAEMLARIAEKEIARRVEARQEAGGIVLRAAETAATAAPALTAAPEVAPEIAQEAGTPAPEAAPEAAEAQAPEAEVEAEAAEAEVMQDISVLAEVEEAEAEAAAQMAVEAEAQDDLPDAEEAIDDLSAAPTPAQDDEAEALALRLSEQFTAAMDTPAAGDLAEDSAEDSAEGIAAPAPVRPRRPQSPALADPLSRPHTEVPHPDTDSVAAKLARIRSVVAREESPAPDYLAGGYSEDEHAEAYFDETADNEAIESLGSVDHAGEELKETVVSFEEDWEIEVEAPAEEAEAEDALAEVEVEVEAEAEPQADEVAQTPEEDDSAALDSILAGLEQDSASAPDEIAPESPAESPAEETAEVPAVAQAPETGDASADEDELDAILDRLIHRARPAAAQSALGTEEETAEDAFADMQEAAEESREEIGEQIVEQVAEEIASDEFVAEEDVAEEHVAEEDGPESPPAPQPIRARVMKMKRADFEAAIDKGLLEEDDSAYGDAPAETAETDWDADEEDALSPEDEAELQRELAAVEAEMRLDEDAHEAEGASAADADDLAAFDEDEEEDEITSIFAEDDEDDGDVEPATLGAASGQPRPQALPGELDNDVNRLMAKAKSEMDEPEGLNRRASIAHLRAAVAATKAEKQAGGLRRSEDHAKAYQDDLASVVRPRRLTASEGSSTRRPTAEPRPAPLKLVAEQRVDADAVTKPAAPVRPRRVSMAPEPQPAAPQETEGFADYAEEVGASTLPELLEAAAAYLVFVENREQFSRPQLMTKARQVQGEDFSREDGLRSFGLLLRQGKIEKLKGGRFAASDSIGYRPDARAAG